MAKKYRTYVYVDGFNLYYGALKGTSYKWLDLRQLCESILKQNDIVHIRYFTAKVSARSGDLDQPKRQEVYLRALRTIPGLSVHFGHFLSSQVRRRLVSPLANGDKYVDVYKTEEKGSDVNLASYLLHDGHRDLYDVAVVVSNDSDLATPIRIVQKDLKKRVGVLNPCKWPANELRKAATFLQPIRQGVLMASQLPTAVAAGGRKIHKPSSW